MAKCQTPSERTNGHVRGRPFVLSSADKRKTFVRLSVQVRVSSPGIIFQSRDFGIGKRQSRDPGIGS